MQHYVVVIDGVHIPFVLADGEDIRNYIPSGVSAEVFEYDFAALGPDTFWDAAAFATVKQGLPSSVITGAADADRSAAIMNMVAENKTT